MAILEKLEERMTRNRRTNLWPEPSMLEMACDKTGIATGPRYSDQEEYELIGKLRVSFWANRAQYEDARLNAERLFLMRLYGNILPHLAELRSAISNGDASNALSCISEMEKEIGIDWK